MFLIFGYLEFGLDIKIFLYILVFYLFEDDLLSMRYINY